MPAATVTDPLCYDYRNVKPQAAPALQKAR